MFFQGRSWSQCIEQFTIPDAVDLQFVPDRLNVTLHFTSPSWVTVADGTGRLYLLHSGDRKTGKKWKVLTELIYAVPGSCRISTIYYFLAG